MAGQRLQRTHVDVIDIGQFFAIHLNRDEALGELAGNSLILEALTLHHVTPVTGRVSDR